MRTVAVLAAVKREAARLPEPEGKSEALDVFAIELFPPSQGKLCPVRQLLQLEEPGTGVYSPGKHCTHAAEVVAPSTEENVPKGHLLQNSELLAPATEENVPAEQL